MKGACQIMAVSLNSFAFCGQLHNVFAHRCCVLHGEGRAISTLWELDAKNLVLSMIETQTAVTVIIITLVRKLKYYDCLLSYFTELGKKQWTACGLCQVSSSKSGTT